MVSTKDVIVRALDCIKTVGYRSKDEARIQEKESTAEAILSTLAFKPVSEEELADHGQLAEEIIKWITSVGTGDEYLENCKWAALKEEVDVSKRVGYLASLPNAYARHKRNVEGLDKVTQKHAFAADPGRPYSGTCEVINVIKTQYGSIAKLVDGLGYLITFSVPDNAPKLNKKDIVQVSGTVYKNKFSEPVFETNLSKRKLSIETIS